QQPGTLQKGVVSGVFRPFTRGPPQGSGGLAAQEVHDRACERPRPRPDEALPAEVGPRGPGANGRVRRSGDREVGLAASRVAALEVLVCGPEGLARQRVVRQLLQALGFTEAVGVVEEEASEG